MNHEEHCKTPYSCMMYERVPDNRVGEANFRFKMNKRAFFADR